MSKETIQIGNRKIEMGNLDKIIFPEIGLTQRMLLDYYLKISDYMLPHLKDRPLTIQRFPDGIDHDGFYQKNVPDYFPDWTHSVLVNVKETHKRQRYIICNNVETLAYLVDQGTITFHTWQSRRKSLKTPDRILFDLDPPGNEFELVKKAAFYLKKLLEDINLAPYVMTTGSRGLHVVVPIYPEFDFEKVRTFARKIADVIAGRHPHLCTTAVRKKARDGRLFIDYLRNSYGQNSVTPYSVRPKTRAPVATPVEWHELQYKDTDSQKYSVKNIFRRLGQKKDPWSEIQNNRIHLDHSISKVNKML